MSKPYQFCPMCTASLAKNKEGYQACTSETCNFVHYENPTPVVGAIVEYEEEAVVLVQNVGWPSHWYGLVTGFLEKHEHPDEAVLREVQEEIGLNAELVEFRGHYTFEQMNQIIMIYHVKASGPIVKGEELADYKVVPIERARGWGAATGIALDKWLKERRELDA